MYIYRKLLELAKSPSQKYKSSKDHARAETKRQCVKLTQLCGRLLLKKKKKMEKIAVWPISVYTSSDVSELFCECCWVQKQSRVTGR